MPGGRCSPGRTTDYGDQEFGLNSFHADEKRPQLARNAENGQRAVPAHFHDRGRIVVGDPDITIISSSVDRDSLETRGFEAFPELDIHRVARLFGVK